MLRTSHDHLRDVVETLGDRGPSSPSYCTDWTIAQVLSHLGSGAEIARMGLEAALSGNPPPDRERYTDVWARWDAYAPEVMVAEGLASDEAHIARLEGLDDAELDALAVPWFDGSTLDASGVVVWRLAEHAVHTWDVEVMERPAAGIAPSATDLLVHRVPERVGIFARGVRPAVLPSVIEFTTTDREISFSIAVTADGVAAGAPVDAPTRVEIPSEALIRLTYGRLDPEHTPEAVTVTGTLGLDDLRALFPGF